MRETPHPSDQELLLAADRESSPRDLARLRAHLTRCPLCQERMSRLQSLLAGFISSHEETVQLQPSSQAASREALRSRLMAASSRSGEANSWLPSWFPAAVFSRELASAAIALVLVAGAVLATRSMLRQPNASGRQPIGIEQLASALPRKQLTPGLVRTIPIEELCANPGPENDPPVDASMERAVFQEYGLSASARSAYVLDYLIAPALGGVAEIQNLWPQPYSSTWNARAKDRLEDHLHQMVCQGKLQLATAQGEMASDWIEAYKRYFNTDRPEPDPATVRHHPEDAVAFFKSQEAASEEIAANVRFRE